MFDTSKKFAPGRTSRHRFTGFGKLMNEQYITKRQWRALRKVLGAKVRGEALTLTGHQTHDVYLIYFASLLDVPLYDGDGIRIVPIWCYKECLQPRPPAPSVMVPMLERLPLLKAIVQGELRLVDEELSKILHRMSLID